MKGKKIKLFDPYFGKEEELALKNTLQSRFWASGSGVGKVSKFEKMFNKYIGSNRCVALNSGTAALHLALSLIDIKNKQVILPSLSFVSTVHAVLYNGGKPIFVDVEPLTLCMNPSLIEEKITNDTKIILPVHFGGMPCNLHEIMKISKKNNLILIEDAAHAAGSSYNNKKIGNHGTAVCFSFHPVKNLAMPSGGAITLNGKNSKKYEKIIQTRRWCGISNRKGPIYNITDLGWNYYMNEFSAAIGLEQLKKIKRMNLRRLEIATRYINELKIEKKMPFNHGCSYHMFWIQVSNRTKFMKYMLDNNIETGIHYRPIHKMKYYQNNLKLPITESAGKNIVSLPIHPNLKESDISKIIHLINKFS